MIQQRNRKPLGYAAIGILGGLALVYAPHLMFRGAIPYNPIDPARVVLTTISITLTTAWAIVFAGLSYFHADEFLQQGPRVAWYWGGLLGLMASLPVCAFIASGGLHWLWPAVPSNRNLAVTFVLGYSLLAVMQMIGFSIVSVWWRLSKR